MKLPVAEPTCGAPCSETERRGFVFGAGATLLALPAALLGQNAQAQVQDFPKRVVGKLSALKIGQPLPFRFPWDHSACNAVLAKLGRPAAGGVGPAQDIVGFSARCTHMGWEMAAASFHADPGIAGPCRGHLTTFDLTRHGMVVSGHATQALPQVLLEVVGDDLVAVGMLGLVFGFADNRTAPAAGG
jgi:arsenite oxidase small subunit